MKADSAHVGDRFGDWTISGPYERRNRAAYFPCTCLCGKERWIAWSRLARMRAAANCGGTAHRSLTPPEVPSRVGRSTALGAPCRDGRHWRVRVVCDCGTERDVLVQNYTGVSGSSNSCKACADTSRRRMKAPPAITEQFSYWTVIGPPVSHTRNGVEIYEVPCRCECGTERLVRASTLRAGESKSCGCRQYDNRVSSGLRHGETGTRLYRIWNGMKLRCYYPSQTHYNRYGGRGITVCEEWRGSYEAFRDWARATGYADDLQIDRIDNDGNYCPDNCEWVTPQENNRRMRAYHKAQEAAA